MKDHTYEEIRDVIVKLLTRQLTVKYPPTQWTNLISSIADVFHRQEPQPAAHTFVSVTMLTLTDHDAELARDVFWDLFRQGVITLGLNDSNPNWPHFRLSHFGERILKSSSPWRFHDSSSYIAMVRTAAPDIKPTTVSYLEEAAAAFHTGCLLAACVMLGVAAEVEFLRLVQVAIASPAHGTKFKSVDGEPHILRKIIKFQNVLDPLRGSLSQRTREGLDSHFGSIQSVLRVARNDAGHATSAPPPPRELVYVYLQLFVPFARHLMYLREELGAAPPGN